MLDQICIRSGLARKCWLEAGQMILAPWLVSRPDPSSQNLTLVTVSQNRIRSGLVLHNLMRAICGRRVWKWESNSVLPGVGPVILASQLASRQICLAKTWPGHPDWIRVGFAQYGPGLWENGTELDTGSWIQPNSGCMLAVMAITGLYQNTSKSDPACFPGN